MKLRITTLALATLISSHVYSFQCPTISSGITLVHAGSGSNWILQDTVALNNGWYVIQDPIANNRSENTVF